MTSENMCEENNANYSKEYFESAIPDFGYFQKRSVYLDPIASLLTRRKINRALDIGAADGALVYSLLKRGVDAYGVDISSYAILNSPLKKRLRLVDIDKDFLPFPNSYFDLVTALETLEHLYRPENAISEIARVLKPSGFVFMTTPSPFLHPVSQKIYQLFACPYPRDPTHVSELPKNVWLQMLHSQGLKPIPIPKLDLVKIKLGRVTYNARANPFTLGPISTSCGLGKLGPSRKIVQFVYDLLFPSPQEKIIILAIKRNSSIVSWKESFYGEMGNR